MQRVGTNRRIIIAIICFISVVALILIDYFTKIACKNLYEENGETVVIDGFFYLSYTVNTGSAYGLFSNTSWGQTFFKIITPVALVLFVLAFVYALKRDYKVLKIAIVYAVSGTVGNFIDRVSKSGVTDFLSVRVNSFVPFGIFNVADVFMCVGVVLIIIHLLFLDKNGVFKVKKHDRKDTSSEK